MEKADNVIINGKQLRCLVCGCSEFNKVYTRLNKKWFAALDLELLSPEGVAYICRLCGYKHEFFKS